MSKTESSGKDRPESTDVEEERSAAFPKPPPPPRKLPARVKPRPKPQPPPLRSPPPASGPHASPPLPRPPSAPAPQQDVAAKPPPPPSATGSSPRPQTAQRPWHIYGLVALLVLGLGVAAFVLTNRSEESANEESEPQTLAAISEAQAVDGGQFLIDARPWGEVVSLVGDDGEEIELPPDRQTPLVLDLTPGRYTAFLTHPELVGGSVSCEVEISAEVGGSCRLDLLEVTPEDYWEDVGWWR